MGLFSKIAKGIKSGTSSGFASLGKSLEEEQSTRRQMRSSAFGSIDQGAIQRAGSGYTFDLDQMSMLAGGGTPEYADIYTEQAGRYVQTQNQDLISSTDKFLAKTGMDSFNRPIYDMEQFPNIATAVQSLDNGILKTSQFLENQKGSQAPAVIAARQTLSDMQSRRGELTTVLDTMTTNSATRGQNAKIAELLQGYGDARGAQAYQDHLVNEVGLDPTTPLFQLTVKENTIKNITSLAGSGAYPQATKLINSLPPDDQPFWTEFINMKRIEQQYPGLVSTADSVVKSAQDQQSISMAYDVVSRLKDGPQKEAYVQILNNNSKVFLNNQRRTAMVQELDITANVVSTLNGIRKQVNTNLKTDLDTRLAIVDPTDLTSTRRTGEAAPQYLEMLNSDSPEVIREVRKQMNALFPAEAERRTVEKQTRSMPGMSIPDVQAIKGLQQVNLGMGYDEVVFKLNNSEHLTLREKIETKQIMDRVGGDLGFDVLQSKTDDAGFLNKIHVGIPSWAEGSKQLEDNAVVEYSTAMDEAFAMRPPSERSGTLNAFYPNTIAQARDDLEVKEIMGLLPVGGTDRIVKRLTAKYLGDEGMAKMTDGDAETAAPTAAPTEADTGSELAAEYERILATKMNRFGTVVREGQTLTEEEEEIIRRYREETGLDPIRIAGDIGRSIGSATMAGGRMGSGGRGGIRSTRRQDLMGGLE